MSTNTTAADLSPYAPTYLPVTKSEGTVLVRCTTSKPRMRDVSTSCIFREGSPARPHIRADGYNP